MGTILLLCGLPGSGKSTLLTELRENMEFTTFEVDDFLPRIDEHFSQDHIRTAMKTVCEHVNHVLREQPLARIAIADVFERKQTRQRFRRLAVDRASFGMIWLRTPLEVCLMRNQSRDAPIPFEVVQRLHNEFEEIRPITAALIYTYETNHNNFDEQLQQWVIRVCNAKQVPCRDTVSHSLKHKVDVALRVLVGQSIHDGKFTPQQALERKREVLQKVENEEVQTIEEALELFSSS